MKQYLIFNLLCGRELRLKIEIKKDCKNEQVH